MAYPEHGTFESGGPCPASHPVRMSQLFYEVVWDTSAFNDLAEWPEDGSQPFVWSFDDRYVSFSCFKSSIYTSLRHSLLIIHVGGDRTGFANHGDYIFGWKDDALQRALDSPCYVNCPTLKTQDAAAMNKCTVPRVINEDIDGWVTELPGGYQAQYIKKRWT